MIEKATPSDAAFAGTFSGTLKGVLKQLRTPSLTFTPRGAPLVVIIELYVYIGELIVPGA